MKRLILILLLLTLSGCIAPDGSTVTIATIDDTGTAQVQVVEVAGVEEWHRGFWTLCILATATETGYGDISGCTELTAHAYQNGLYSEADFLQLWDWELVQYEPD